MRRELLAAAVVIAGCGGATATATPGGGSTTTTTTTATATTTTATTTTPVEPPPGAQAAATAPAEPSLDADARAMLDAHNQYRSDHCAPPLAWSAALARTAQAWADGLRDRGCALVHSQSGLGENLAAGTAGPLPAQDVAALWYRESSRYSFRHPGFSMQTGHFTQLVWRATTAVGCGRTTCGGLEVWVCNYDPPGNVERAYEGNVLPTSCRAH